MKMILDKRSEFVRIAGGFICLTICAITSNCSDPSEKITDSFASEWHVHKALEFKSIETDVATLISEDSKVNLSGLNIEFAFVKQVDSDRTKKSYWDRLLGSDPTVLTHREILEKKCLLGGSGTIYPFSGSGGNSGYLVVDKGIGNTWCQLWSPNATWTSYVRVADAIIDGSKCKTICQELSQMQWAYESDPRDSQ